MISLSPIVSEPPLSSLSYAVHVPNLGQYGYPLVLVSLAVEAEQAGWDGLFLWDHMLHRRMGAEAVVDPCVTLAACAVETEQERIPIWAKPAPASTCREMGRGRPGEGRRTTPESG
jgi:hypothetical protein